MNTVLTDLPSLAFRTSSPATGGCVAGGTTSVPHAPWPLIKEVTCSKGLRALHQVIAPGAPNIVKGHDGNDWLTYHSNDPNIGGLSRMLCAAPMSYVHSIPKVRLQSIAVSAFGQWHLAVHYGLSRGPLSWLQATLSWQVPEVAMA